MSTCTITAPQAVAASIQHQATSIFVDGIADEKHVAMLIDTGVTRTIIRPDIVKKNKRLAPSKWQLRTATGDTEKTHGEADINITLENICLKHRVLVANIEDEFILGIDLMNKEGFELNFKNGMLKTNGEE